MMKHAIFISIEILLDGKEYGMILKRWNRNLQEIDE